MTSWNSNPSHLQMWPYLERGSLQRLSIKLNAGGPSSKGLVSVEEEMRTQTGQREDDVKRRGKTGIHKQRREPGQDLPSQPPKEPALLTPGPQTASLQNWQTFLWLSHSAPGVLFAALMKDCKSSLLSYLPSKPGKFSQALLILPNGGLNGIKE